MYSRAVSYGRNLHNLLVIRPYNWNLIQNRNVGHVVNYRVARTTHSKAAHLGANLAGTAMWWWILWHLWHEYEHITGEFYYPEPESWSNQELGIPDDERNKF